MLGVLFGSAQEARSSQELKTLRIGAEEHAEDVELLIEELKSAINTEAESNSFSSHLISRVTGDVK